ncbi:MAG TPA: RlmE family RNA methyltransferase, partial [Gammaproteobacteria bacterium]|nr:RlmE family RNA methyltransferase [Gammaproteobacteria bacterium]
SFKLKELQKKYNFLRKGMYVVDLGAAPGGWSQVAVEYILPNGKLWALDLLEMTPIPNVQFIQGDFTDPKIVDTLIQAMGVETKVDWILSDLAPNLTGLIDVDQPKIIHLLESVFNFSNQYLKPQGGLLVKAFQGEGIDTYVKSLKQRFSQVLVRKPDSSRAESREIYVLARGYNI